MTRQAVKTLQIPLYVQDVGFYLNRDHKTYKALDLLLLTQGWRRFKWEEVLDFDVDQLPTYWAENGIITLKNCEKMQTL